LYDLRKKADEKDLGVLRTDLVINYAPLEVVKKL